MEEFTRSIRTLTGAIDVAGSTLSGLVKPRPPGATAPSPPPTTPPPPDGGGDATTAAEANARHAALSAAADAALRELAPGYFEERFDPLGQELAGLPEDAKQSDIDAVVERLTAAVEVVSGRLKRHVLQHQEKLIQGITNVITMDSCVKAAFVTVQGARQQLRLAQEDVASQVQVVGATRKKQRLMGMLELTSKLQSIEALGATLKRYTEAGEFGEAILTCLECQQLLEPPDGPLAPLAAVPSLRALVQRHYLDTLQRLDAALLRCCAAFTPEEYSRLLEGYLLQGIAPAAMAAKVMAAFHEALHEAAVRVVRGTVLASRGSAAAPTVQSSAAAATATSLLDGSYPQLCRQVPARHVRACLQQLLELFFDILASYDSMEQFHEANQEAAALAASMGVRRSSSSSGSPGGVGAGGSPQRDSDGDGGAARDGDDDGSQAGGQLAAMAEVQAATLALLRAVSGTLASGRGAAASEAGRKLLELLRAPGGVRGEGVAETLAWCETMAAVGDAFEGCTPSGLRSALEGCYGGLLDGVQAGNMEALRSLLAKEQWASTPGGAAAAATAAGLPPSIKAAIKDSPLAAAAAGWAGRDVLGWIEAGNPFAGRRSVEQLPVPQAGGTPAAPAAPQPRVATKSSSLVLAWLRAFAALLVPLKEQRPRLWRHICELFDNYLLACFVLFSGVSLETLAWQDECLPHRLRRALLRIMTSPGCKYKSKIEELLHVKPQAKPLLATGPASFLDFSLPSLGLGGGSGSGASTPPPGALTAPSAGGVGSGAAAGGAGGSSTPSRFDIFTRKLKETVVDLINTDLSQPYDPSGGGGQQPPRAATPGPPQAPSSPGRGVLPPRPVSAPPGAGPAPRMPPPAPSTQAAPQQQQQPSAASPQKVGAPPAPSIPAGQPQAPPAAGGTTTAAPPPPTGSSGRWGLRERAVAVESLTAIADELREAKGPLLAALGGTAPTATLHRLQQSSGTAAGGSGGGGTGTRQQQQQQQQAVGGESGEVAAGGVSASLAKEVESYMSRTVDAVIDLKDAIFGGATRQLLQAMFDPDRGTAAQIAAVGYSARTPASSYQPWSDALLRHLQGFGAYVAGADLPGDIQKQMWEHAVKLAAEAVLDGLAACRRCSVEGRAAMSLDWGHLENGLQPLLPPGAVVQGSLRLVDGYIKAFYMPWEELPRWSQQHLAEYGKAKILALIDAMAEAYGVKRAQHVELGKRLSAELDEFA